jgi:GrpB-like predicted nucleotidyltransferase (UPF0157 family)
MTPASDRTTVTLHPHDPTWPKLAQTEASRLAPVLGANLIAIEHIGSTAVPGIHAKPTIDMLPIVHSIQTVDAQANAIETLGYRWRGEFGLPGRRYCTLDHQGSGRRLFNVHIFETGSPEIDCLLAFRDYLRARRDEALAYEYDKKRAAALHPDDTLAYNDAKSPWIKQCETRALAWWSIGRTRGGS